MCMVPARRVFDIFIGAVNESVSAIVQVLLSAQNAREAVAWMVYVRRTRARIPVGWTPCSPQLSYNTAIHHAT